MAGLSALFSRIFSRHGDDVSVPAMDGVFKPNNRLEEAERVAHLAGLGDVAPGEEGLVLSAGRTLHRLDPGGGTPSLAPLETVQAEISFVTALADGRLAVGQAGRGLLIGRPGNWTEVALPPDLAACMSAGAALPDGRLALCVGSRRNPMSDWKRDLMEKGATGLVGIVDPDGGAVEIVAEALAFPTGVVALGDGRLAVAESWRHRIIAVRPGRTGTEVLLDDLPAYPARLAAARDGTGVWLTLFAPRRQLFEFILGEDRYRLAMMESIDPDEWVGPALRASSRPDHPLQQGAVRQMGILKPWAPSSSYGLVVRCDRHVRPVESWHSRADGTMHGMTGICDHGDGLFAVSRGAGTLLRLDGRGGEGA